MSRTKGALNKDSQPTELTMPEQERLGLLIDLILETVAAEELCIQD